MNLYINTLFVCSSYTPERKYPLPLTGKSRSYTIAHPYNLWFGARKHMIIYLTQLRPSATFLIDELLR